MRSAIALTILATVLAYFVAQDINCRIISYQAQCLNEQFMAKQHKPDSNGIEMQEDGSYKIDL